MLSIVIPTLNEEKLLPQLLNSIKEQDFSDYEIIVADAESKDKTREIAKSFGCKIVKGGLPAKGRNEGAKIAKGDLILFLDADTALPEGSLKKLLKEFRERKLVVASCSLQPFGKNKMIALLFSLFFNWPVFFLQKLHPYAAGFILIKKDLHRKIGGFDEEIKILEDGAYVKAASSKGRFGCLKSAKIFYSHRRFKKEGWVKTYLKYILAALYMFFFGPVKSDIFKYRFGRHNEID